MSKTKPRKTREDKIADVFLIAINEAAALSHVLPLKYQLVARAAISALQALLHILAETKAAKG